MFAPALLPVLRAGTAAFIATKPTTIRITHNRQVPDGAGGYTTEAETVGDPVVVSILEPRGSGYVDKSTIPEGTNTINDFLLLGPHDLEIGLYDTFTADGFTYRVENLMVKNGYEVRAKITREAEGGR